MNSKQNRASVLIGTLLLASGLLTLIGQIVTPGNSGITWSIILLGAGLAFFIAMFLGGKTFGAFAIPGSILIGLGGVLFLQSLFSMWSTWSYTWTLIICFIGIGLFIYGSWGNIPNLKRSGLNVAQVGLILFIIFGILFDVILTGSAYPFSKLFWPLVLILIGLAMLIVRSYRLLFQKDLNEHTDINLFWPVIFIGAGLLWFFIRQEYISLSQLNPLVSLWPLLIIAVGVNIILGRRFQWINLLFGVIVVAGMFYIVFNGQNLGLSTRSPWGNLGFSINNEQPITQWISGSGKITKEERKISDIHSVVLKGAGDLEIIQGDSSSLFIEAEDNLIPYIKTTETNGRLTIEPEPGIGFTNVRPIHFILTVKGVNSVSASGSTSVRSGSLQTDRLKIDISGYGSVSFEKIEAKQINLNISGSGNINAAGSVQKLDISISGAGGFNGPDLKANEVNIEISGIGRAVVWAVDRLEPSISGVGNISYYGDPVVKRDLSGLSNINRLGSK